MSTGEFVPKCLEFPPRPSDEYDPAPSRKFTRHFGSFSLVSVNGLILTPQKAEKFVLTESDLVPKRFITLTFTEQLGETNVCFAMKTLNPSKDFFPFGKINASVRRNGSSLKL